MTGHRRAAIRVLLAALCVACDGPATAPPDPRPNVLVVMWDTVRRDRLGVYGHDRRTTPHLDAFAADARVYEHAITPSPWTFPAHAAIFTGLHPRTSGATGPEPLDAHFDTLAERLTRAGYATILFTSNPWVSSFSGLDQGFATVESTWSAPWSGRIAERLARRLAGDPLRARALRRLDTSDGIAPVAFKEAAPDIVDGFWAWRDARPAGRPWFAFLNFMEAHAPRMPTRAERLEFASQEEVDFTYAWRKVKGEAQRSFSPRHRAAAAAEYDAALRRLDAHFGALVAGLEGRGELDRTLVVLVSDHGELLGEHALYGHGQSVYGALIEVPLILRHPSRFPPGRTARPVDTRDLFPTILDMAGASVRDGESPMACSLADAERACPEKRPLVSERLPQAERHKLGVMRVERAIELDGHRLIRHDGAPVALYDASRDPGETVDLRADLPERVRALEAALDAWIDATPRYEPGPRREEFRRSLDPEMVERLQALGYLE